MTELVKYVPDNLPATIDGIQTYLLIGKEQLKAHQAKLRAIDKIPEAHAARGAALQDAQTLAKNLLAAEAKLGKMLAAAPKQGKTKEYGSTGGTIPTLPPGLTKKESHQAQTIARNPEVVEKVTAQAVVKGELPTAKEVYKEVNKLIREARLHEASQEVLPKQAKIINNDCLEYLDSVKPIDLLLTDPPYFTDGNFTAHISAYLGKVKDTGQAYVFIGSSPDEVAAYLAIDTHRMTLEQILVWNYNNTGQRQPNKRYTSNYQFCLYYRGPEAPDINKPGDGTHQYACQTINAPDGRMGDRFYVWQKPDALIERLIRNSSNPDDFVFDPFAGSGTVVISAARLGREAAGCEVNKDVVDICVTRGCILDV